MGTWVPRASGHRSRLWALGGLGHSGMDPGSFTRGTRTRIPWGPRALGHGSLLPSPLPSVSLHRGCISLHRGCLFGSSNCPGTLFRPPSFRCTGAAFGQFGPIW